MTEDTIALPVDKVVEFVREMCLMDCRIEVSKPEFVDLDKWTVIKEAECNDIEYAHGDLHIWLEDETRWEEKVARATRWQPAEYKNHYLQVWVGIAWDMGAESLPTVHIEVEHP